MADAHHHLPCLPLPRNVGGFLSDCWLFPRFELKLIPAGLTGALAWTPAVPMFVVLVGLTGLVGLAGLTGLTELEPVATFVSVALLVPGAMPLVPVESALLFAFVPVPALPPAMVVASEVKAP